MTEQPPGPDGWQRPQQRAPGEQPPRSLQIAAVLLIGLGGMLVIVGALWIAFAASLQLDPELAGQLDLETLGALGTVGFLALFVGSAQVVAGIGVLRLRRSSRVTGILSALVGAIGLGLGAVFAATGSLDRYLRGAEMSGAEGVVLCLAIAGAYLIAAIALTQDWPQGA